jgi:hypothetical protein
MRLFTVVLICVVSAMPFAAALGSPPGAIDQRQDAPGSTGVAYAFHGTTNYIEASQTFRVGRSGKLTGVDLNIEHAQNGVAVLPLTVDIRRTNGSGFPVADDNQALVVTTIPATNIPLQPDYVTLDFSSSNIPVQAGDLLAIVLSSSDSVGYAWLGHHDNLYPAGGIFYREYANPLSKGAFNAGLTTSFDFNFRTYVDPVPEPATAVLSLFGIGMRLVMCSRQNRKHL